MKRSHGNIELALYTASKRGVFPHWFTNLWFGTLPPDLLSSDSSSTMAMKSRDWSSSADTHYQIDLRHFSRLSVRIIIIRLFQSPVGAPFIERLWNDETIGFSWWSSSPGMRSEEAFPSFGSPLYVLIFLLILWSLLMGYEGNQRR